MILCQTYVIVAMHKCHMLKAVAALLFKKTCNQCLGESMACTPDVSQAREKRKTSWHAADKPTEPLHSFKVPEPLTVDMYAHSKPYTSMATCGLSAFLWFLQVAIIIGKCHIHTEEH